MIPDFPPCEKPLIWGVDALKGRPILKDTLRERYLALPNVQREAYFGATKNWSVFKRHIDSLRNALYRWKIAEDDRRGLSAVIWDATETMPDGHELLHFNERRQRFYLLNGLWDLCRLFCDDINQERSQTRRQAQQPDYILDEHAL